MSAENAKNNRENPIISIVFNIVLPAAVLTKLSKPEALGPIYALVLALGFPVAYSIYDFIRRRKASIFAILGFITVLLKGGLSLLQVSTIWFAVNEATVPLLIGIAVVASLRMKTPLVRSMLYNENVIDVPKVDAELNLRGNHRAFDQLLVRTTWLLAMSFLLSAILNFALAVYVLKSPTGTPEFNAELGRMTVLSYPVIVVPCMLVTGLALWTLLAGIKKLTGLDLEQVFKSGARV